MSGRSTQKAAAGGAYNSFSSTPSARPAMARPITQMFSDCLFLSSLSSSTLPTTKSSAALNSLAVRSPDPRRWAALSTFAASPKL
eukprot:3649114-Rhodomonas_salina.1